MRRPEWMTKRHIRSGENRNLEYEDAVLRLVDLAAGSGEHLAMDAAAEATAQIHEDLLLKAGWKPYRGRRDWRSIADPTFKVKAEDLCFGGRGRVGAWADHVRFWTRDGEIVAVAEPYPGSLTTKEFREIAEFCDEFGIDVQADQFLSTWYPAHCIALVFTRPGVAIWRS